MSSHTYDLQVPAGTPPIKVIDVGQAPADIVDTTPTQGWVEVGGPYSPGDDEPPRLNLDRRGLEQLLDQETGRLNTAARALDLLLERVASTYGRTDDAATWAAVREQNPELDDAVSDAIRRADSVKRTLEMNAAAIVRETQAAPMRLLRSQDEERAARLLPLIDRQAEGSLAACRDGLRTALTSGDDAACFVWATVLPARLKARPADDGERVERVDPRIAGEIQGMISTVKERLRDDSLSDLRTKAQGLKGAAARLGSIARTRRNAIDLGPGGKTGLIRREGY